MKLIIFTPKVDTYDDHLAFSVDWLREFARQCEKVTVITFMVGQHDLPPNVQVQSLGKDKGFSKLHQLVRFYKYLWLDIDDAAGVFVHTSPIFAVLAWPVTAIYRKKLILWHLHRAVTLYLHLAAYLCDAIVTANKASLQLISPKIIEVGHGIDIARFTTNRSWINDTFHIVSIGRISPIKNYETFIDAATLLRDQSKIRVIEIIGRAMMKGDAAYQEHLKSKIQNLNLEQLVKLSPAIPYSELIEHYKTIDILVNLTPSGGIDKVVLEAMASGALILTSNEVFRNYFGSYAKYFMVKLNDAEDLAEKIKDLMRLSVEEKRVLSNFLVQEAQKHSVIQVVTKIRHLYD